MYCSNGSSSMATLLQQKNCMKTLTNGAVTGGGNTSANSAQTTRVLLPHEMVSIPSASTSTLATIGSATTQYHHPAANSLQFGTIAATSSSSSLAQSPVIISSHHQNQQHPHNSFHHQTYSYYTTSLQTDAATSSIYRQTIAATPPIHHPHIIQNCNIIPVTTQSTTISGIVTSQQQHNQNQSIMIADSTTQLTRNDIDQISTTTIKQDDTNNVSANEQNNSIINNSTATTTTTTTSSSTNSINNITNDALNNTTTTTNDAMDEDQEPEPEIDIVINNVVCSFSVRCHLNLREIALNGINVEFRRENGMVTMKLRRPYTTASIWSSGRITCTGATSEDQAKIAARRYARCLQRLGFKARFRNFRVVNVLGTCSMPWAIKIVNFSEKYKHEASYEPELHPGVTYKIRAPKATLKIFSTGSITVTASSVANVQSAIEHIFPLVYEFRKKRIPAEPPKSKAAVRRKDPFGHSSNDPVVDNMYVSDVEENFVEEIDEDDDDDDL